MEDMIEKTQILLSGTSCEVTLSDIKSRKATLPNLPLKQIERFVRRPCQGEVECSRQGFHCAKPRWLREVESHPWSPKKISASPIRTSFAVAANTTSQPSHFLFQQQFVRHSYISYILSRQPQYQQRVIWARRKQYSHVRSNPHKSSASQPIQGRLLRIVSGTSL